MNGFNFRGAALPYLVFPPSDPFSEGLHILGKHTGSHESCNPCRMSEKKNGSKHTHNKSLDNPFWELSVMSACHKLSCGSVLTFLGEADMMKYHNIKCFIGTCQK